jgi:hypothetical protein
MIGAIVQGFTCLAAQTTQCHALEGLEDCPTSTHLINDNRKHKPQYINKIVHQTFSNC